MFIVPFNNYYGAFPGYSLTMITEGQRFVCSEGESVILLCDFHAQEYNLFDYPVLWKKQQHDEIVQVCYVRYICYNSMDC
jgi:hypothetical protein